MADMKFDWRRAIEVCSRSRVSAVRRLRDGWLLALQLNSRSMTLLRLRDQDGSHCAQAETAFVEPLFSTEHGAVCVG